MRRHDFDLLSLLTGLFFAVLGVGFVVVHVADLSLSSDWLIPAVLIAVGVAGLAASFESGRRRAADEVQDQPPANPDETLESTRPDGG